VSLLGLWLLLAAPQVRAEAGTAELQSWVDRAGVRGVLVVVHSPACADCAAAVPRWKLLKERWGRDGLRVLVLSVRDPDDPGRCAPAPWAGDGVLCDLDGSLPARLGVRGDKSAAFLWGWDRRLLVSRGGVSETERAVETLFATRPRVRLMVDPALEAEARTTLERELTRAIRYSARLEVVAGAAPAAAARAEAPDECPVDGRLAADLVLFASSTSREGAVRLRLSRLETGCIVQTASGSSALDAVEQLQSRLRVAMSWPVVSTPTSVPLPPRDTPVPPPTPKPPVASGPAVPTAVRFVTEPAGAVLQLDGRMLCQSTPCDRTVTTGKHRLTAMREEFVTSETEVVVSAAAPQIALTLVSRFASLQVTTRPPGLPVSLDGGAAAQPLVASRLAPGAHTLVVVDTCHAASPREVRLVRGESRREALEATPRRAGLRVTLTGRSAAASGEVWVDGTRAGAMGARLEVPLCAQAAEVRLADGGVVPVALALAEGRVQEAVVQRVTDDPLWPLLEHDLVSASLTAPPELARRAAYGQACAAGDATSCAMARAERLPLGALEALPGRLLAQACQEGRATACFVLAWALLPEREVALSEEAALMGDEADASESDDRRAQRLARQLCDRGLPSGCRLLATALLHGAAAPADEARAEALFEGACKAGDARACGELASRREGAAATALWEQACTGGSARGCVGLARVLHVAAMARGLPRPPRVATLLSKACEAGDREGCLAHGVALSTGSSGAADVGAAVAPLVQACRSGVAEGCRRAGLITLAAWRSAGGETGRGVAESDEAHPLALLRQACAGGDGAGCAEAGALLAEGRLVTRDRVAAAELLELGCESGIGAACSHRGLLLIEDEASDEGVWEAATLWLVNGCERGHARGCLGLGTAFALGRGVDKDEAHAATLYERACDGGEALACDALGVLLATGRGVEADPAQASNLFERACTGGGQRGCTHLGVMISRGDGGRPRDPVQAFALFQRSCTGGDGLGCHWAGQALESGNGVAINRNKAVESYRQGCRAGEPKACARLDAMRVKR